MERVYWIITLKFISNMSFKIIHVVPTQIDSVLHFNSLHTCCKCFRVLLHKIILTELNKQQISIFGLFNKAKIYSTCWITQNQHDVLYWCSNFFHIILTVLNYTACKLFYSNIYRGYCTWIILKCIIVWPWYNFVTLTALLILFLWRVFLTSFFCCFSNFLQLGTQWQNATC